MSSNYDLQRAPAGAHSPLPWSVCEANELAADHIRGVADRDGWILADTWALDGTPQLSAEIATANAEFIVRAVNSHAALVDALNELWYAVHSSVDCEPGLESRVVAALAKAEKSES